MSQSLQMPFGHAIPPTPRHAITVHVPLWSNLERWIDGDDEIIGSIKNMYPRLMLHVDVRSLGTEVWKFCGSPDGQAVLLFSNYESAAACKQFATDLHKGDSRLSAADVKIKTMRIGSVSLSAVFFPESQRSAVQPFWTHTGTGISSRLAEYCLANLGSVREVEAETAQRPIPEVPAHGTLRRRIAGSLKRDVLEPLPNIPVRSHDVYLYPTGMAAVYAVHRCLRQRRRGFDAIVGFPFKSTYILLEKMGDGVRLFNSAHSLELLEIGLETAEDKCRAIWTEVPSNPLLSTADLLNLRGIADRHGILLVVDDTIGSFCNVDMLAVADILVTSLTKSFSGYADVMGGSLVLNPASSHYAELKSTMQVTYVNDYWSGDAETLEQNSRDYLPRSEIMNENAVRLVSYLDRYTKDERSTVAKVYYPTTNPDRRHFDALIRPKTVGFAPGYGCLFTVEFASLEATIAFYDNLSVYNGPHLGAHLTLAMAYVKSLYSKQRDWVEQYGLRETQIRISVGLEEFESVRDRIDAAVIAADLTKVKNS